MVGTAINHQCNDDCTCSFKQDCRCKTSRVNETCPHSRYEMCVDKFKRKMGLIN